MHAEWLGTKQHVELSTRPQHRSKSVPWVQRRLGRPVILQKSVRPLACFTVPWDSPAQDGLEATLWGASYGFGVGFNIRRSVGGVCRCCKNQLE